MRRAAWVVLIVEKSILSSRIRSLSHGVAIVSARQQASCRRHQTVVRLDDLQIGLNLASFEDGKTPVSPCPLHLRSGPQVVEHLLPKSLMIFFAPNPLIYVVRQ